MLLAASFYEEYHFVIVSVLAGLGASVACGIGVFPLLIRGLQPEKRIGLGYGFTAGLMFSASVYNLLLPAIQLGSAESYRFQAVFQTLVGMSVGCAFLWLVGKYLTTERLDSPWLKPLGGRVEALVFVAMVCHSIPEGVAVGVGYASEAHIKSAAGLGHYIAVAIAIHNMPEGLAVGLPMRARGASIMRCFWFAFLTSLPQPIAAVPASLLVWLFEPLMLPFLGFAAGSMMYLVIGELIPDGIETRSRDEIAWAFMAGFALMIMVQMAL